MPFCHKTQQTTTNNIEKIMVNIILVGLLPCNNGQSCELHPFGCGNLVSNQEDYGMGMLLQLRMMVTKELSYYTINRDGSNGCRVCFVACEYATRENGCRLDRTSIYITDFSKAMRRAVRCSTFITTIVVSHTQELSIIIKLQ